MKKKHWVTAGVAVVILVGLAVFNAYFSGNRLTSARLEEIRETKEKLDLLKAEETGTAAEETAPETPPGEETNTAWPAEAPDVFNVQFACSQGDFVIECHKDWAPIGTQRFYDLVKMGFYDEARFFRVVPGFVVQFGMNGDPKVNAEWKNKNLQDEPLQQSNVTGMVSFAKTAVPNTRSTQVFINLADNSKLDKMASGPYAPFGKVIEGIDAVMKTNPEYGAVDQTLIGMQGNQYLKSQCPRMDYIKKATLIK